MTKIKDLFENLKIFSMKSKRVWHALKKPTKHEFISITKISAIGIAILGVLGFLISIVMGVFK